MNNDIKEILDYLKDNSKSFIICGSSYYKISDYKAKILLDYITNLQTIEQQYSAILSENAELDKYKKVIDKIKEVLNKSSNLTLDETGYKEYIKSTFIKDKDIFKTICHLEDFELIYGEINELLEEIE